MLVISITVAGPGADVAAQSPNEIDEVKEQVDAQATALSKQAEQLEDIDRSVQRLDPLSDLVRLIVFVSGTLGAALGLIASVLLRKRWIEQATNKVDELVESKINNLVNPRIEEAQDQVNEQLNRLDISRVPVHVPKDLFMNLRRENRRKAVGLEKAVHTMLQGLSLKSLPYENLADIEPLEGCVIVEFQRNAEDPRGISPNEPGFVAFLQGLSEKHAGRLGFVIYASGVQVSPAVTDAYPYVTFANSVVTVSTNVLTIARSVALQIGDANR